MPLVLKHHQNQPYPPEYSWGRDCDCPHKAASTEEPCVLLYFLAGVVNPEGQ